MASNDDYVSVHSSIHSMIDTPKGTHCLVKAARMRAERQRRKEQIPGGNEDSDSDEEDWDLLNHQGQVLKLVDPPERVAKADSGEAIDIDNVGRDWDLGDTRALSREARLQAQELPEHMVQIDVDTYIQDLSRSFEKGSLKEFPLNPTIEDHGGVSKDQQQKPLWRRIWKQFTVDFKRQDVIIDDFNCKTLEEVRRRLDHLSENDYMNTIMLSQQGALAPPIELLMNAFTTAEYSTDQLTKLEIVALGELSDEDEKLIPKDSRISHSSSSRSRKMVVNIRTTGGPYSSLPLPGSAEPAGWGHWAKSSFVDPITDSISGYVPAGFHRQNYRKTRIDQAMSRCRVESVMNPDKEKMLPLPGASACVMLSKVFRVFDGEGNTQATVQLFLETVLDSDKGSQDVALTWREL